MKQFLSLALALLPCLAWAQYPSNGNQKITLGEQTTADGLIWRGVLADTGIITPSSDTSAYIILDTVNHRFYHYNRATNVWSVTTIGSISSGLTGVLPVANGGTGQTTLAAAGIVTGTGTTNYLPKFTGTSTIGNSQIFDNGTNVGIGTASPAYKLNVNGTLGVTGVATFSSSVAINGQTLTIGGTTNNAVINNIASVRINIDSDNNGTGESFMIGHNQTGIDNNNVLFKVQDNGNVGIGTASPQSGYRLHVVDSVYVGGNVSASAYTTRSDYDLKDEIQNISYGINEVMQMQPVKYTYKSNGSTQLGFIAQDLGVITPEVVSFEDKMSVYYNALIPILTKAIQEQQALIKSLEQRILILENK